MKTELRIRWNPFLSLGRSPNQSQMALNLMNAHDLQASVLREYPLSNLDKDKLHTLCLPWQIGITPKKLLNGFKAKNPLTLNYPRNFVKAIYIQSTRF